MPTIHPQISPRHKTASITDQKHRGTTIFLRRAQAAQHVLFGPVGPALGILFEQFLDHGRDDVAGRDGVDANTVFPPFRREITR